VLSGPIVFTFVCGPIFTALFLEPVNPRLAESDQLGLPRHHAPAQRCGRNRPGPDGQDVRLRRQGAQRVAAWLAGAARRPAAGIENAQFWYAAAERLLAPVLFAAAQSDGSMADVVRWIDTHEDEQVRWGLELANDPAPIAAFDGMLALDERTRSNVHTTAGTLLIAFADPGVLAAASASEFRGERLLDGGCHTAYLCAPAHEQRRLQPLFATIVQEILAAAYERAAETGKPIEPPLLLVLDECANIAPLRELATLASKSAGQGIQLVSVFQDLAQINAVYGRDHAPTIVSNHRAKVILSGVADPPTLEYVARLLGDEEVRQLAATSGAEGRRSTTESVAYRTLAPANLLREMRPGEGVLVMGTFRRRRSHFVRGSRTGGYARSPQPRTRTPSRRRANVSTVLEDLTKLPPKRLERRLEELSREALQCVGASAFDANPQDGQTVGLWIEARDRRDVLDLARVLESEPGGHVSTGWLCSRRAAITHTGASCSGSNSSDL
jgi:hypothetical protein